jgi:thioredoxin 1
MAELKVNKGNITSEVINSEKPVLLDFWADWCMPCKMMEPVLESVSREHDGEVRLGKVNVDDEPEIASQYNIVSIPTLLLIDNGKEVKRQVGAVPKKKVDAMLKDYL